jgi:hypothetical protein
MPRKTEGGSSETYATPEDQIINALGSLIGMKDLELIMKEGYIGYPDTSDPNSRGDGEGDYAELIDSPRVGPGSDLVAS